MLVAFKEIAHKGESVCVSLASNKNVVAKNVDKYLKAISSGQIFTVRIK